MVDYEVSAIEIAIVESETPVDYFLRLFSSIWSSEFIFLPLSPPEPIPHGRYQKLKLRLFALSWGQKVQEIARTPKCE